MSRKAWCCTIAVWSALSSFGLCRADDNDTYNSVKELEAKRRQRVMASQTLWWEHFIPGRIEEKKKIAEGKTETASKDANEKEAVKPKPAEPGSMMQQELQKYLRREEVCNRLRQAAEETKDPELARQADMLESRALAAYEQKVSAARSPRMSASSDRDSEVKSTLSSKNKDTGDANSIHTIPGDVREQP